jgi:1,2-phenylacetyl-CoA epoxidase catalytic subunit
MAQPVNDLHELDPSAFLEETQSFEFWFQSVEGYLSGKPYGHDPDLVEPELTPQERDRLTTALCNYCVGEMAALEGASGLIHFAPNRETKIFLATQAVDEARHLEVLYHRLAGLGVTDPEREIGKRATRALVMFKRRLLELVRGKDWEAALFAQNVILEAMEFTVFQTHAQNADPITREVLEGIIKDERRHMGFGENEIGRRLRDTPHIRARLGEIKRELDPLVLETFSETMSELGLPRDQRPELGRSYLAAVERLGFGSD